MRIESNFNDYYDHCYDLGIVNDDKITLKRYTKSINDYNMFNSDMIKSYAITFSYYFPKKQRLLMNYKLRYLEHTKTMEDIICHYGWDGYFLLYLSCLNCYIDTFHKNPHLRSMFNIVGFCDYIYTAIHLPEIYYDRKLKKHYIVYDNCYYIDNRCVQNVNSKEKMYKLYNSVDNIEKLYEEQYYYHETKGFVNHFDCLIDATTPWIIRKIPRLKLKSMKYGELYAFRFVSKSPRFHKDLFERLDSSIFSMNLDFTNIHWNNKNLDDWCFGHTLPNLSSMNFDKVMDARTVYKTLYEYVTSNC